MTFKATIIPPNQVASEDYIGIDRRKEDRRKRQVEVFDSDEIKELNTLLPRGSLIDIEA